MINNGHVAFISQPMVGLTDDQILDKCERVKEFLADLDIIAVDNFFQDEYQTSKNKNKGLWFLGNSLELMSTCDIAYFCYGWEKARGCRIEHEAARAYGLTIIEESKDNEV